jgi:hypothetical protein
MFMLSSGEAVATGLFPQIGYYSSSKPFGNRLFNEKITNPQLDCGYF